MNYNAPISHITATHSYSTTNSNLKDENLAIANNQKQQHANILNHLNNNIILNQHLNNQNHQQEIDEKQRNNTSNNKNIRNMYNYNRGSGGRGYLKSIQRNDISGNNHTGLRMDPQKLPADLTNNHTKNPGFKEQTQVNQVNYQYQNSSPQTSKTLENTTVMSPQYNNSDSKDYNSKNKQMPNEMFDSAKFEKEARERESKEKSKTEVSGKYPIQQSVNNLNDVKANLFPNEEARYQNQVGVSYKNYEDLVEFENPMKELANIESDLKSDDWNIQFDAVTKLRSIFRHHSEILEESNYSLSTYIPLIMKICESLRSGLSKNALLSLNECIYRYKKKTDRY